MLCVKFWCRLFLDNFLCVIDFVNVFLGFNVSFLGGVVDKVFVFFGVVGVLSVYVV